ncbi:hypothetical protein AbraIFM66951_010765 [Aspergillus brasiliensis]|uniref:FUN14 domain-containing protein n=1 Tax=Aspergillus brasiliensis TaxID=319629 RepID=A0A9W5YHY1_9EURO|nr:hypothetical protein AbraCBS73388_008262 [Aspergillus brasiliensis]GKZ47403.1 hypothetical protein AbraIFM66951_010765 [Aspergillus brasiliensis]
MSFLLNRTTTTLLGTGLGVGLSLSLYPLSPFRAPPMQCQYTAPYYRPENQASPDSGWSMDAQDPLLRKQGTTRASNHTAAGSGGILTASNMRQVSLGSVLGLVVGVGLRAFSRVLVVLLGMGIVAVEWAAARGYNLLPVNTLQKYFKRVDLQKTVSHNIPFKISFGATMGLAAFAQF